MCLYGGATADLDSFCARRRPKSTVGAEESLRRGRTKESAKARKKAPTEIGLDSAPAHIIPIGVRGALSCPTPRDFVPWRFSDAGRRSAWLDLMPASENLHITCDPLVHPDTHAHASRKSDRIRRLTSTSSTLTPRLNPHSSSLHRLCPTSRDFVPWRFSDAGRISAWRVTSCRRPRNLHISGHQRDQCRCQTHAFVLRATPVASAARQSPTQRRVSMQQPDHPCICLGGRNNG